MSSSVPPFRFWSFFFSLKGRVSRRAVWCFVLPLEALLLGMTYSLRYLFRPKGSIDMFTSSPWFIAQMVVGLVAWITLWPVFAIIFKRLHDRGWSGLIALPYFAPMLMSLTVTFMRIGRGFDNPGYVDVKFTHYLTLGVNAYIGLLVLALAILPGSKGANRFGPHPRQWLTASDLF